MRLGHRTSALQLRKLVADDIAAAADVSSAAFGFDLGLQADARRWRARLEHLLNTDPEGGFVAERDGRMVGVAQAMVRERLWCLSLLTVAPGAQGAGAGRALLGRALGYGAGLAETSLIVSSNDPRALRAYGLAGFSLRPAFETQGSVDRRALPRSHRGIRQGGEADLEAIAPISREIRGAPHTVELEYALRSGAQLLRLADRGFAVVHPAVAGSGVWLLVARDDESARALLWEAISLTADVERPSVRWITAGQDWAIDVVLGAGLRLSAYGALCVRGSEPPLRPFLPSPPFG